MQAATRKLQEDEYQETIYPKNYSARHDKVSPFYLRDQVPNMGHEHDRSTEIPTPTPTWGCERLCRGTVISVLPQM